MLHPGQVLRGSLPLLSPQYHIHIYKKTDLSLDILEKIVQIILQFIVQFIVQFILSLLYSLLYSFTCSCIYRSDDGP